MKPGSRVAVLCGGPSCEREVSLLSGAAVREALASRGFAAHAIDPVGNFLPSLREFSPEAVFLALHGTFGEDGTIQRILEGAKIPFTGSGSAASSLAFDKAATQRALRGAGVPVPEFEAVNRRTAVEALSRWKTPFVAKPACSGSSYGITIVRRAEDAAAALEEAFQFSEEALLERYVSGRELTVGILGGEALPVVEIIPDRSFYDYEAKYRDKATRYEAPAKLGAGTARLLQGVSLDAFRALGCEVMGRVDVMLGDEGPQVLEINTIPGLTGRSLLPKAAKAAGLDFPELCVKILNLSLERHHSRNEKRGKAPAA